MTMMDGSGIPKKEDEYRGCEDAREFNEAFKARDIKRICKILPRVAGVITDDIFTHLVSVAFAKNPKTVWLLLQIYFACRRKMARKNKKSP